MVGWVTHCSEIVVNNCVYFYNENKGKKNYCFQFLPRLDWIHETNEKQYPQEKLSTANAIIVGPIECLLACLSRCLAGWLRAWNCLVWGWVGWFFFIVFMRNVFYFMYPFIYYIVFFYYYFSRSLMRNLTAVVAVFSAFCTVQANHEARHLFALQPPAITSSLSITFFTLPYSFLKKFKWKWRDSKDCIRQSIYCCC